MTPISLLCEIIGQTGKVAAQAYRDDARYGALLDAGLIQRNGVVQSVLCENCHAPHDAEIVFEGGSYGHYCPEIGFVPVERAEIVAVHPNLEALVEQLHAALDCGSGGISQLGPQTWRVGLVDTPGGRAAVYFHPNLSSGHDLVDLETALRCEVRRDYCLVVSATGELQYRGAATVNMTQMVSMDLGTTRLNSLVTAAEAVRAPRRQTGGRPNLHRERLHAMLAERVAKGLAENGRNEEAKAVLAAYVASYPSVTAPKLSTVKAYVSEFRSG